MMKSDSILARIDRGDSVELITKMRRPPSIQDCVSAQIIRNYDSAMKETIEKIVFVEMEKTVRWFNLNEFKRPDTQIMIMWSESLCDQYELESVEDFIRFFNLIRKGNINLNFYERLGYDVIQKAFSNYLAEMKIPEKERQLSNEKIERQKSVDRSEVIQGYSKALEIIDSAIIKNTTERKSSKSSFSKGVELKELKENIDNYPRNVLESFRSQYENISSIRGGKVIRDKGLKILESRLSLIALRKYLNGKK